MISFGIMNVSIVQLVINVVSPHRNLLHVKTRAIIAISGKLYAKNVFQSLAKNVSMLPHTLKDLDKNICIDSLQIFCKNTKNIPYKIHWRANVFLKLHISTAIDLNHSDWRNQNATKNVRKTLNALDFIGPIFLTKEKDPICFFDTELSSAIYFPLCRAFGHQYHFYAVQCI